MLFLVSKTYDMVDTESAECGDFADTGFCFEDVSYDLNDLVRELKDGGYIHLSDSCVSGRTWASTESQIEDYRTDEWFTYHLHVRGARGEELSDRNMRRIYHAAGIKVR